MRITALPGEAEPTGSACFTEGMADIAAQTVARHRKTLPPYSSWRRRLRHNRSDDHLVAFLQFAFQQRRHFGVRVIGDSDRHFDGLHPVVGLKFPDHCAVGLRLAWKISHAPSLREAALRHRIRAGALLLFHFDSILLVNR